MKKVWLIGGAMMGCYAAMGVVSCSSSSTGSGGTAATTTGTTGTQATTTGTNGTGGTTSSTGGTSTVATTTTSTGMGGTGTTTSTGTGVGNVGNCGTVSALHPPSSPGANIYCPFSTGDAGKPEYCQGGTEVCCETAAGATMPSECIPIGMESTCPMGLAKNGSSVWECEQPSDCAAWQICCAAPYAGTTDTASIALGTPMGTCNTAADCPHQPDNACTGGMCACGNFASDMGGTKCTTGTTCAGGFVVCSAQSDCATGTCTPLEKAGNQIGGCM
jgi:hypothetical protein